MKNTKRILYIVVIIIGGGLLIYDLTGENNNVYLKIIGLVLLMFGLYTATQQWVADNEETKDDEAGKNQ